MERALWVAGGRESQAEGTACAKALRREEPGWGGEAGVARSRGEAEGQGQGHVLQGPWNQSLSGVTWPPASTAAGRGGEEARRPF